MNKLREFWKNEEGVTAIEYALVASLIAMGIIVAVGSVATHVVALFNKVVDSWP